MKNETQLFIAIFENKEKSGACALIGFNIDFLRVNSSGDKHFLESILEGN